MRILRANQNRDTRPGNTLYRNDRYPLQSARKNSVRQARTETKRQISSRGGRRLRSDEWPNHSAPMCDMAARALLGATEGQVTAKEAREALAMQLLRRASLSWA
jgi:hypothetical protein